jgi:ribonuclease D
MHNTQKLPNILETQDSINNFVSVLSSMNTIGLDTEFVRIRTYYPKLCLVQIAYNSGAGCIDYLQSNDLNKLWQLIFDPKKLKIFHSARQDLEILFLIKNQIPENIFDTQIGAALLGYPPQVGIKQLLKNELNIDISKTETRSDWSKRPLDLKQIEYALEDVNHLLNLHNVLEKKLKAKKRYSWALEDSSRILTNTKEIFNPDSAWKKISGIKNLKNKNQHLAVTLATWREQTAIQMDLPRQWVLSNQSLIEIAKKEPTSLTHLENIGIINRYLHKPELQEILKLVKPYKEKTKEMGKLKPKFKKNYRIRFDTNLLNKFSKVIAKKANELKIFPEVLASKKDLLAMVQEKSNAKLLTGWRKKIIGSELKEFLNNL